jgi:TolB protein
MKRPLSSSIAFALAATACCAPAAEATFPGERGPIAFERLVNPRAEVSQIFAVDSRGGGVRRLSTGPATGHVPDYSPDGSRIAFERRFGGESPDAIWTMNADGSGLAPIQTTCSGECLGDLYPAWSPDGARLAFSRAFGPIVNDNATGLDLMAANADGSGERLIRHFLSLEGDGREPHDPQWSPDGRRIAVNLLNIAAKPEAGSAIFVLDADGGNLRRITPKRLNAGNPDWSPSGKRIVFNSSYEGQAAVELYTVRPNGKALRRVRRNPKGTISWAPVWAPDGRRLAFVHHSTEQVPHIWTMKPDGTWLRQVTRGPKPDFRPDWGARPR